MPTDFSPTTSIVKNAKIPARIRNILNVESGYNDGIVAPLFVFALTVAGDLSHARTPEEALWQAVPATLIAVVVGVGMGCLYAWGLNVAGERGWLTPQSTRIGVFALPILTYALTVSLTGNGFVAAFVCGIAFTRLRKTAAEENEASLVEDMNIFGTLLLWFVFGSVCVLLVHDSLALEYWPVLILALLALTVLRIIPVLLSFWGSDLRFRDRVLIGTLGPRGTASMVFGLLAFNALPEEWSYTVLLATISVVFLSVLLHGLGSQAVISVFDSAERRSKNS